MDTLMQGCLLVFGEGKQLGAGHMAARAILFFFVTLVLIRLSGRRSFGQRTPFDSTIVILLGAILSRAVVGANDMLPVTAACLALVLAHRTLAWLSCRYHRVALLMNGHPRTLIDEGKQDQIQIRRALLNSLDMDKALHIHGLANAGEVRYAWLEPGGEISLVRRSHKNVP